MIIELDCLGSEVVAADARERRSARSRSRNWIFSGVWGPAISEEVGVWMALCFFPRRWLGFGIKME